MRISAPNPDGTHKPERVATMQMPLVPRDGRRQIAFAAIQQEERTTIEFPQNNPPPFALRSIRLVNESGDRTSVLDGLHEDVEAIILGPLC
jgi:hypothetical protein